MARALRRFVEGYPLHIVQRGNNRNVLFRGREDYRSYLTILEVASKSERCGIHAYVLMTNHVHLLLTPSSGGAASRMMKHVLQAYAQLHNRKYERSGGLYEGRYRASVVQTERYFLLCQRYIELNPVRAGMVSRPEEYPWSSHRSNLYQDPGTLLTPHPLYAALSGSEYRSLFSQEMNTEQINTFRQAINSNRPVGDEAFVEMNSRKRCRNDGV